MPYNSDQNLDESEQNSSSNTQTAPAGQVSGQPSTVSGSTGTQNQIQNTNSATEAPAAPTLASGTGITTSGNAAAGRNAVTPGSGQTQSFNANNPTNSGSSWTNLQNYLNANNGGQFGSEFAGKVGNTVSGAQNAVNTAANNFQGQVNQGTTQTNSNVNQEVGTDATKLSEADQNIFKGELGATYTGPKNTSGDTGFQQAAEQTANAQTQANQANTPGGQTALLQQFYRTPNYSQGQQTLDAALLSADQGAQSALQGVARQASDVSNNYQKATQAANNQANQGAETTAQAQLAALQDLYGTGGSATNITGGAFGNIQNAQAAQLAAAQAQQAANSQIGINPSQLTAAQLQQLGLTQGQHLYGVDINQGLQLGAAPTSSSVTTAQQAAQLAALSQLAGISNSFVGDPSQVGTYTGAVSDPTLQAQISAAQAAYTNGLYGSMNGNQDLTNALKGTPWANWGYVEPEVNAADKGGQRPSLYQFLTGPANIGVPNTYTEMHSDPTAAQILKDYQDYYQYGDVAGAPTVQGGFNTVGASYPGGRGPRK